MTSTESEAQLQEAIMHLPTGMGDPHDPTRIILDPSFLFTDEAMSWLDAADLLPWLVISESLWRRLEDPEAGNQFLPYGVNPDADQMRRVRLAVGAVGARFSYREAAQLPEGTRSICEALLSSDEPLADVLADEWAFLTSQSLGKFLEKAAAPFQAFGRAGAKVYRVTDDHMERGLNAVRQRIPDPLVRVMKAVGNFPPKKELKFIVSGGSLAVAILAVPHVGIPVGAAKTVQAGLGVIAGDP
jgi:hypothetical protein